MITFLNGREVLITYDVDVFANARDDLKDAGVEFKIKSKAVNSSMHMVKSRHIFKNRTNVEYRILVKDEDYNRALHIIHRKEGWK